jgi:hypothetical protein
MRKAMAGLAVSALALAGCGGGGGNSSVPAKPSASPTSSASAEDAASWGRMFAGSTPSEIAVRCADVKTQGVKRYAQGLLDAESMPISGVEATLGELTAVIVAHCATAGPSASAAVSANAAASKQAERAQAAAQAAAAARVRAAKAKAKSITRRAAPTVRRLQAALQDARRTKVTSSRGLIVTIRKARCSVLALSGSGSVAGRYNCAITYSNGYTESKTIIVKASGKFKSQ